MQHSTESQGAKIVTAISAGFLLGAGQLNHAIVIGGIGLVTLLRLPHAPHRIAEQQADPAPGVPVGDDRRIDD